MGAEEGEKGEKAEESDLINDAKAKVKDAMENINLPKMPKVHKPEFMKKKGKKREMVRKALQKRGPVMQQKRKMTLRNPRKERTLRGRRQKKPRDLTRRNPKQKMMRLPRRNPQCWTL